MRLKRQEEMPWIQTTKPPPHVLWMLQLAKYQVDSSEGKDD